jgi:AraC-like DNA-binding protein
MFTADGDTCAVPDGTNDVLFFCDKERPEGSLFGTVTARCEVPLRPGTIVFGVRLHPGVIPGLFGVSCAELVDSSFPLNGKASWRLLAEEISGASAFGERIKIFSRSCLHDQGNWKSRNSELVNTVVRIILSRHGCVTIRELEEATHYSSRYIDRVFSGAMGMPPKLYCRLIRFQRFLRNVTASGFENMTDIALEAGYFDHSHMLRDFRTFTKMNPSQFLQEINLPAYKQKIIELSRI